MKKLIPIFILILIADVWMVLYRSPASRSDFFGPQIEQEVNPALRLIRTATEQDSVNNPQIRPGDLIIDTCSLVHTFIWYEHEIVRNMAQSCEHQYVDSVKLEGKLWAEQWIRVFYQLNHDKHD